MQSENNKINEDIDTLQEFDQTVTDNLNSLAGDIVNLEEQTQLELAALQQNVTDQGVSIAKNTDDINQLQETLETIGDYDELIQANSDNIETLERFVGSLSNTVEENRNRIEVVENVSDEIENLSKDIEELSSTIGQYDDQIDSLQVNITAANSRIDEVEENHKYLRNDFEYLKYDFRSFTNEISKWQIDVDERLNQTRGRHSMPNWRH